MIDAKQTVKAVEVRRKRDGLTQEDVARGCGISQGHYCKIVQGRVPVGRKSAASLAAWLDGTLQEKAISRRDAGSVIRLAASIQRDCQLLASMVAGSTAARHGRLKGRN